MSYAASLGGSSYQSGGSSKGNEMGEEGMAAGLRPSKKQLVSFLTN